MKHTNRQVIGLLIAAMLCLLFAINVKSLACGDITCMLHAATTLSPLAGLSIGIALLLIAMAVEWNAILNNVRVESMSLNVVESKHPRLPKKFEIAIAATLSVSLLILFVQFILTVYAMSFSLSSATTESKDTRQVILGDFDGDFDLDYIAGNSDASNTYMMDLYTNDSSGIFLNAMFGTSEGLQKMEAGDIDGDGDLDLVYAYVAAVGALGKSKNNGAGIFSSSTFSTLITYTDALLNDFNNDGSLDLLVNEGTNTQRALWLNDGHGNFMQTGSTIPAATRMTAADFNSDGSLDIAMSDSSQNFKVYLNSGTGSFALSYSTMLGSTGPIIAGDFDGDGTIDIVASDSLHRLLVQINNGNGTSFAFPLGGAAVPSNLEVIRSIAAGDIDNDGDLDVLASGGAFSGGARLFLNDGLGNLTENGIATEITDDTYGVAIGDIDGDDDLDYVRGNDGGGFGAVNRHYKSDQAATSANTAPTAPSLSSLTGSKISHDASGATIRFFWGSGSDAETSTRQLQYQLQIGTGSNSNSFVSGKTASPNFVTRLMPNGQSRTELLKNIPCGHTYYFSVAAVDTGFKSARSSEKTFTLDSNCVFNINASSSLSSSSPGGSMWKLPKPILEPKIVYGHLIVSAFEDINGNGRKDPKEKNGFSGIAVTASGTTAGSGQMLKTVTLSDAGDATFDLEPSDDRGYRLTVDTGSDLLKDYVFLGETASGSHIVREDSEESVSFAFRRRALLGYKPCLDIDVAKTDAKFKSDAGLLLSKLQDSFSSSVLENLDLSGALVTRRTFLTLLLRTQCIALHANPMDEMKQAAATNLLDLSQAFMTNDGLMFYSLLAEGLPVLRSTANGFAADLSAPISRREAVMLLRASMKIEPYLSGSGDTLPIDLAESDPIVPDFLALKSIGILPKSFLHVFGAEQGIDPVEMPILFTRAAFRSGHISLLPVTLDKSSQQGSHAAAGETPTTFLDDLPSLPLRSCLETDPKRSDSITFSDLLPGDARESSVRSLLSFGTKNDDDKTLWLLTGTKKPTEFGIRKGSLALNTDAPVSLLDTVRTLLVLRCLPPLTAKESLPELSKSIEGSADSRVTRDFLSGLKRDTSFESRTLYRAQDHEKEFDLSLFTFAPRLLQGEPRSPESPLSIEEGSDLLASALLNLFVHEGLLSTQQAENKAQDLSLALQKQFLGDTDLSQSRILPLSRGMLLDYLSTILIPQKTVEEEQASKDSLGEIWWKRVGE